MGIRIRFVPNTMPQTGVSERHDEYTPSSTSAARLRYGGQLVRVKVCPKCGSENKPDKASCSGCYASLEGVVQTEGAHRAASAPDQPVQSRPPAAQPLGQSASSSPGAMPSSNYAPPGAPSSYGPTFSERRQPTKQPMNWGAIIFVILILAEARSRDGGSSSSRRARRSSCSGSSMRPRQATTKRSRPA